MLRKSIVCQLAASTLLASSSVSAGIEPSSVSVQYGDNFENQNQVFLDLELSINDIGYLNLGVGSSDYALTSQTTLTTDYYSIGYSSPSGTDVSFGLNYDYWELHGLYADSYTARLNFYTGNWSIGLHPELHYITFSPINRRELNYRNAGGGISIGYISDNKTYLYAEYYSYYFSTNQPPLRNQISLSSQLERALRLIQEQVASSFDDQRTTIGADYYFDTANIGVEYQQATAVIDASEYKTITLTSSLSFSNAWHTGVSVSHTHGSDDEFYTFNLGYDWE
ncbi:hypothetical protein ACFL2V_06330 [Pseudomonadota bacterium]